MSKCTVMDDFPEKLLGKLSELGIGILHHHNFFVQKSKGSNMDLPLGVSAGNPVHFRGWYIFQIGMNTLPGNRPSHRFHLLGSQ